MAGGWSKDGAIQDQIDASIEDAVKQVREKTPTGESLSHCQDCGEMIPAARREAIKGVRRCVECQEVADKEDAHTSLFNRRGSKDSQLR